MKLRRFNARVFGPLCSVDVEIQDGLVLLYGRNESGKSSFRSALETLLYGFEPATRDAHPLVDPRPESPSDLHIEAEFQLDSGEVLRVERELQATGKTRTARGGEPFSGERSGNGSLALVEGIPRPMFRSLYSIELSELTALDRGVKEYVDDLLLPAAVALDLRPAREVRQELGRDHRSLWRADNRGKPKIRELREELSNARLNASEATRRERRLRDEREERDELAGKLEQLRAQRQQLERTHADAPLLAQIAELRHRRARLGEPVDLAPLYGEPLIDPSALRLEIQQLDESLEQPRARISRPPVTFTAAERLVLTLAPDIDHALEQATEHEIERRRASDQREGAELLQVNARRELAALLGGEPDDADVGRCRLVAIEALRAAQGRWSDAWETWAATPPPPPPHFPGWAAALGFAGLAFAGTAAILALETLVTLSGVGIAVGALLVGQLVKPSTAATPPPPPPPPAGVADALGELQLPEDLIATPTALQRTIEILARAKAAGEDATEVREESGLLAARVAERDTRWRELCAQAGLDPGHDALPLDRLQNALERARQAAADGERDSGEREQAREIIDRLAPNLERKRGYFERVAQNLRLAEPDSEDLLEAYTRVQKRLDESRFLRRREEELARDPRHRDLADHPALVSNRIPPPWEPGETDRRIREIDAFTERIESTNQRLGELAHSLDNDDGSALARTYDLVRDLEASVELVERQRDRLALLDSIVARAEREHRDAHQPDVLRRAGEHLQRITGGRYTRLDYLRDEEGGLQVRGGAHDEPVPVSHPLSRGTLDQIFLCLRLGLLDHLDTDRERLPLVLDDALLRMDDGRRLASIRVLGELAAHRQVFLLTCHNAVASEVEQALGVTRISLSGDSAP